MIFNNSSWFRETVRHVELSAFLNVLDTFIEYFNMRDIQRSCYFCSHCYADHSWEIPHIGIELC